uniref:Glycosyl transferase family 2 n=1 Tax=Geobacter sp. (strain M21) TaxID=443144 RepID=C6E5T9_GEOSM
MSRVSIIVVNWNGWRDTLECLESLEKLAYPDFGIVLCDNGSTDESLERIREWARRHQVSFAELDRAELEAGGGLREVKLALLRVGENLGFAGGNNVGLSYALAQDVSFCWLLNNDTVVEPDALTELVARMEQDQGIGICGSSILYYHDRDRIQALGGGYYHPWLGLPLHYGRFTPWRMSGRVQGMAASKMNYVEGASMLVSRRFLLEIGVLSEEYFLYFEEADWAMRARGRFSLGYAARSVVYHKVGGSIGTSSNPGRKSLVCDFYNIRNRIRFARRYHPLTLPTVYLVLLGEIVLRALYGRWDRVAMILGLMMKGASGPELRP